MAVFNYKIAYMRMVFHIKYDKTHQPDTITSPAIIICSNHVTLLVHKHINTTHI